MFFAIYTLNNNIFIRILSGFFYGFRLKRDLNINFANF